MAIDSAKFLGRNSSDTATLSNKSIENISTIASTLIDVNTIMNGNSQRWSNSSHVIKAPQEYLLEIN